MIEKRAKARGMQSGVEQRAACIKKEQPVVGAASLGVETTCCNVGAFGMLHDCLVESEARSPAPRVRRLAFVRLSRDKVIDSATATH